MKELAHHTVLFQTTWDKAPSIPFPGEGYRNGTSYFKRLVDFKVSEVTATEDPDGRRLLLIPFQGKTFVLTHRTPFFHNLLCFNAIFRGLHTCGVVRVTEHCLTVEELVNAIYQAH